ncbi:hypothetical protein BDF20DRAFT_833239 [Mycotypha africana]|uniref:uncharacterized protein n=1 Tax=Mycotypha africana TaxID=64632 RepID=UPI002300250B|nr:uncharacterized protein BDF20DRAFT_833239 [Mycotypha africana]KAI8988378.1 hypothetical protein BDF20DRAFT_833239 [Mycotypha africana]
MTGKEAMTSTEQLLKCIFISFCTVSEFQSRLDGSQFKFRRFLLEKISPNLLSEQQFYRCCGQVSRFLHYILDPTKAVLRGISQSSAAFGIECSSSRITLIGRVVAFSSYFINLLCFFVFDRVLISPVNFLRLLLSFQLVGIAV